MELYGRHWVENGSWIQVLLPCKKQTNKQTEQTWPSWMSPGTIQHIFPLNPKWNLKGTKSEAGTYLILCSPPTWLLRRNVPTTSNSEDGWRPSGGAPRMHAVSVRLSLTGLAWQNEMSSLRSEEVQMLTKVLCGGQREPVLSKHSSTMWRGPS